MSENVRKCPIGEMRFARNFRFCRRLRFSPARRRDISAFVLMLCCALTAPDRAQTTRPTVQQALEATTDVWGEEAIRQPNGPSYEYFENLLPPLRYVDPAFRHYPIALAAPRRANKARFVSNGSGVNLPTELKTKAWYDYPDGLQFLVGDQGIRLPLTAGACCRRHTDGRQHRLFGLAEPLVVGHLAAVGQQEVGALGAVHGTAATDGNDQVNLVIAGEGHAGIDMDRGWVLFNTVEYKDLQARVAQRLHGPLRMTGRPTVSLGTAAMLVTTLYSEGP